MKQSVLRVWTIRNREIFMFGIGCFWPFEGLDGGLIIKSICKIASPVEVEKYHDWIFTNMRIGIIIIQNMRICIKYVD